MSDSFNDTNFMDNNEDIEINTPIDEFLDLYRQLERDGRQKYFPKSSEKEGIMGRLMCVPELRDIKNDLDYCRVVRNFLVHTPKVNGQYPIIPSPDMITFLKKCIKRIKNPILAIDYSVKRPNMYFAKLNDKVVTVAHYMSSKKFTHVPVFSSNTLIGVFSSDVLYTYISKNPSITITEDTTMDIFLPYLPVHSHSTEYFAFVPSDIPLFEVASLFKVDVHSLKQLSAVFLTKTGSAEEHIEAMITPWSILRDLPDFKH